MQTTTQRSAGTVRRIFCSSLLPNLKLSTRVSLMDLLLAHHKSSMSMVWWMHASYFTSTGVQFVPQHAHLDSSARLQQSCKSTK